MSESMCGEAKPEVHLFFPPRDSGGRISTMMETLRLDPFDTGTRYALADAFGEANRPEDASFHRRLAETLAANPDLHRRVEAAVAKANGRRPAKGVATVNDGRLLSVVAIHEWLSGRPPYRCLVGTTEGSGLRAPGCLTDPADSAEEFARCADLVGFPKGASSLMLAVVRADGRVCIDGASAKIPCLEVVWPELRFDRPSDRDVPPFRESADCPKGYDRWAVRDRWRGECERRLAPLLQAWASAR
jgi:hypothetical protein